MMGEIEILLRPNNKNTSSSESGERPVTMVFYTDDLPKAKSE
jgi:hypothetical protein